EGPTGVFQPGKIPDTLAGVKVNTNRDGSISLGFDAASLRIAPDAKIYFTKPVNVGARGNTIQVVPPGQ
nr:hypothetical protein [Alphaproteobacteria bacterium]